MTSIIVPECTNCEYCEHKITSKVCKITFTSMRCIHPDGDDNPNPTIGRAPSNCPIIRGRTDVQFEQVQLKIPDVPIRPVLFQSTSLRKLRVVESRPVTVFI